MDEKLYSAPITSQGMKNAVMRASQYTGLSWTPLEGTIPRRLMKDGKATYVYFVKGEEFKGIPYSSVYEKNTYVGFNVSIETFVSATCNPHSYLYTRDLRNECKEPKAGTFYGSVCSKFVQTVLAIDRSYNTAHFSKIKGMRKMYSAGEYGVKDLVRCDVLLNAGKHTAIVTDILSDESGKIRYVEVSEEMSNPGMKRKSWSVEEYFSHFEKYDVFRYDLLDGVPYERSDFVRALGEDHVLDGRKYDILTRYGDKCNIFASEKEVVLDVLTDGWEKFIVTKDGKPFLEGKATKEIKLEDPGVGLYEAWLVCGEKRSRPCCFRMIECSLRAESIGDGKVRIVYSHSSGKPIYAQIGSIGDSYFLDTDASGDETVSYDPSEFGDRIVRVGFKNEYGVYVSEYVKF